MENTARKMVVPEITIAKAEELTERQVDIRAKKYAELDAEIKRLTEERDKVKAELIKFGGHGKYWTVTYTEFTQTRFDSTRFKKECPELYSKYMKDTKSSRFTVARAKRGAEQ